MKKISVFLSLFLSLLVPFSFMTAKSDADIKVTENSFVGNGLYSSQEKISFVSEESIVQSYTETVSEYEKKNVFVSDFDKSLPQPDEKIDYAIAPAENENIVEVEDSVAYINNEIIVVFDESASPLSRINTARSVGGYIVGGIKSVDTYQIRIKDSTIDEINAKCKELEANKNVLLASPSIAVKYESAEFPNDPWDSDAHWDIAEPSGSNWWLEAIDAPSAWEYSEYFSKIKIGIVDGGFDTEHEDLQGLISFPDKRSQRQNRTDSHGNHVAGIIAAKGNNGVGIAGINQNAELVCCDWNPELGQLWIPDLRIFTGFISVVKAQAKVINISIGAAGSYNKKFDFVWRPYMNISAALYSHAMARLLRDGYDFVVVQSAGNGNSDYEPCDSFNNSMFCSINENNVRTVSGVDKQDILDRIIVAGNVACSLFDNIYYQSASSNYNVDICAPGSMIYSCVTAEQGLYGYKSGTSMAAPMVTGVASLVWSVNPDFSGAQVRKIVCDPSNTVYDAAGYIYAEDESLVQPVSRVVNAKLCVEAALRESGIDTQAEKQP